jgi:cobalt/nickel transport system ATP-binding protein
VSAVPAFEARGLAHRYPDGTLALDGLDLRVAAGERCALLGPNGAGKSTLLLHLNGTLRAAAGSLTVLGLDPAREAKALRRRVGMVFQDPDDQLFSPTLWDDLAFGPRNLGLDEDEVGERVHAVLHALRLEGLESKSPFHLSFGQKKRAALATVLAMRPELWALDEPFSNLDPRGRREMALALKTLPGTLLVATHDLDLAALLCDRAVVLLDGRVAYDDLLPDLLHDRDRLEALGLR